MTESKSLARLEMFSDGIFAIAITLLVLEIKVPPIDSIHSVRDLFNALIGLWPSYFAFAYTFGGILIQWIIHHNIFQSLQKTSRQFLYANGILMMTIVFYPFPTALLAEYINTEYAMAAIVFYGLATVANAIGWFLFFRYTKKPKALADNSFYEGEYRTYRKSNRFAIFIYSSTTIMAIWLPYPALIINVALWVLWTYLSFIEKE